MDQAIQIIFTVIAIGIGIFIVYDIFSGQEDSIKLKYNDLSLEILSERINHACTMNIFSGNIAVLKISSGSEFFLKESRVCYSLKDSMKCRPVSCNVTDGVFLNLTNNLAKLSFATHKYKCNIIRQENITIKCQG